MWLAAAIAGSAACSVTVTSGGPGATSGGGTAGAPAICVSDSACDDGDPCTRDACTGGECVSSPDDMGVPDDGNPCTIDACSSGAAQHTALPDGMPCMAAGAPGVCKNGKCEGGDCGLGLPPPPPPGPCLTVTGDPSTGECVVIPLPDGTLVPGAPQVLGDCHVMVCIAGQATAVVDDSDVPVDGNECTYDVCSNGVPANSPLPAGTPCGGGLVCDGAGACH